MGQTQFKHYNIAAYKTRINLAQIPILYNIVIIKTKFD
uniref:Uncharacterized protein n=1 Tax=Arundo donax TaxID=35708 RepID=A0A0A9BVC3_ARUDO